MKYNALMLHLFISMLVKDTQNAVIY